MVKAVGYVLRNADKFLLVYKASHPRRQGSSIIVRAYSFIYKAYKGKSVYMMDRLSTLIH